MIKDQLFSETYTKRHYPILSIAAFVVITQFSPGWVKTPLLASDGKFVFKLGLAHSDPRFSGKPSAQARKFRVKLTLGLFVLWD